MIKELVFASNNRNKVEELKAICPDGFSIISLEDAGIHTEIEEPFFTLEENAREKCRFIYELTGKNCFAEDTGLEIEALNNEPGVFSARYAGEHKNNNDNINKVLANLQGIKNRKARFRTIISLVINNKYHSFEGVCNGTISQTQIGTNGFGYDSIFIPNDYHITFAEMDKLLKINISHRKNAFNNLFIFLQAE